jgi:uncharacterized protein (TIGR03382 family)
MREAGAVVTGKLPREVIQRIVRQNFGRFRLCYQSGLASNPALAGNVSTKFTIGPAGAVTSATDASSTLADKNVVSCINRAFTSLSFPQPEGGSVDVVYTVALAPPSATAPAPTFFVSGGSTPYVLTRLHVRYDKDSLGEDLVFRAAPAIAGGREQYGQTNQLEKASQPSSVNNFQGRYAIRHAWTGPIACKEPRRGVWGGPPSGQSQAPLAAQKTAFAPRGAQLASFVKTPVAELDVTSALIAAYADKAGKDPATSIDAGAPSSSASGATSAAPGAGDAGATSPAPKKQGCNAAGSAETSLLGLGVVAMASALLRRRRR